jgi:hypothetical protein
VSVSSEQTNLSETGSIKPGEQERLGQHSIALGYVFTQP